MSHNKLPVITINVFKQSTMDNWERLKQETNITSNEDFLNYLLKNLQNYRTDNARVNLQIKNGFNETTNSAETKCIIKLNIKKSQQVKYVRYDGGPSGESKVTCEELQRPSCTCDGCRSGVVCCRKCFKCNLSFSSHRTLTQHMKQQHNTKYFSCSNCQKSFASNAALKSHRISCVSAALSTIGLKQSKSVATKSNGVRKLKTISAESTSFECIDERNVSQTLLTDANPLSRQGAGGERSFQCAMCSHAAFRSHQGLLAHHRKEHVGIRYQCKLCGNMYTTKTFLDVHIRQHHYQLDVYECGARGCDKVFYHPTRLRSHRYRYHSAAQRDPEHRTCTYCDSAGSAHGAGAGAGAGAGRVFNSKDTLTKHVNKYHKGIRYPCPVCHRLFGAKAQVPKHMAAIHKVTPTAAHSQLIQQSVNV